MTNTRMKLSKRFIRLLLCGTLVAVFGQDGTRAQQTPNLISGYNLVTGQFDSSQAARTNPNRQGIGSPNRRDVCNRVGESYYQTDTSPGSNIWYCTALPSTWTNGSSASGTVTSVSASCMAWLTCPVATPTTTPALTIGPASGQAGHEVIGTGNGSSFGPISLTSADLPLSSMGTITGGTWNGSVLAGQYGGTGVANTGFTLTLGGDVVFTGSFNPTFSIPSSSTWAFQSGGGTLAQTGADINGSNQVTSTHLSSPLPFSEGGLGTSTNFAGHTWFGNNTGSTAAPSAQQPACADLSNAANSCSIDSTNAGNINAGTLGYSRLPLPAGGGPAGVVAVLTAATGAISNTATQVIGYTVPTSTFVPGTTYSIEAYGAETTSTSPGNDTFSIEIGSTSLSGNYILQTVVPATASVSTKPVWVKATITVDAAGTGAVAGTTVCGTSSGAFTPTCEIGAGSAVSITPGQSNVIELVYQSGASTSSINFSLATVTLAKP